MQVFYVNIGGGEPTVRKDFWELVEYATAHHVGVKFSTNGSRIDADRAAWVRASDYVDVQISLDGATAEVNDRVRGVGSYATAMNALSLLAGTGAKLSVVVTRENAGQLDAFKAIADEFEATLRLDAAASFRARRGRVGRAASHAGAAARGLRVAARARRGRAHRRLVLPPRRLRADAAGAEPVRRGARRVPDRPDRRRLRVPVRDPRDVPRGQRARGRASRRCGASRSCSSRCGSRRRRARAVRAACTTRAGAGAWRRSSSPGCR